MSARFPHPCTNCGLCCIAITCEIGQGLMRVSAQGPCPALEWEGNESRCGLITHPERHIAPDLLPRLDLASLPDALGAGAGCCLAARVIVGGREHDFAAIPADAKVALVRGIRGL